MPLRANFTKRVFQFNFKARTSRGLMKDKTSWYIRLWNESDPTIFGIGECGPLPGLSKDAVPDFEQRLTNVIEQINARSLTSDAVNDVVALVSPQFSSIVFGLETAFLDLKNGGRRIIFQNDFQHGRTIPINGLIWMGDMDFMMGQVSVKLWEGFRCIKMKVGGLDFDRECDVLNYLRKRYYKENLTVRLDANGAFSLDDALYKLEALAKFNIHSIEQPIKPGQDELEELCRKSPIPVALDEELIGIDDVIEKEKLLRRTKPAYIILKPMLHGGLRSCQEWISVAEKLGIGWWITSSLESSIGLNAICQFTAQYPVQLEQGLGTGKIYENNIEGPLEILKGNIRIDPKGRWDEVLQSPFTDFSTGEIR